MQPLVLPYPPAALNPNKRGHWAAKAKAARAYRADCYMLSTGYRNANALVFPAEGKISIDVTFHPPDRRHRDDDNMVSTWKSGRDGMADAWGVNDKRFRMTLDVGEPVKGGKVVIKVMGILT